MTKPTQKRGTGCPVTFALDSFGDRWSLIIIRDIMVHGKKTYTAFLESDESIATNILINRLKQLETDGIVKKTRDPENRRSYTYTLTSKGRDLAPVLMEMIRWSGKYDTRPEAMKDAANAITQDPEDFERRLRETAP
ncbi:putative HTH-type transcriptional regulator YybR [Roseovarius litorisediminis]|uniref:Putative HTH-type transcriptional regulator YybR n=1 Tax=Roseovarius litorisediminis TaxID=1312363 RepID=A0A1Y5RLN1_9RHOB|nr:helix-turn-helix domain-containing protein [Roseovarius litorisediminis]SLN19292.1 putative HTH-type transcriptional regulator YybR [Roseovarius litorisediminis]